MLKEILLYRKGLRVERLHTIPHIQPYSNGHHSANAVLIADELCKVNGMNMEATYKIVIYMAKHDIAEQRFGDMPSDAKAAYPKLSMALKHAEKSWESMYLPDIPKLLGLSKDIAKCADVIELIMYCVEELNMGNRNIIHVIQRCCEMLGVYVGKVVGIEQFIEYSSKEVRLNDCK